MKGMIEDFTSKIKSASILSSLSSHQRPEFYSYQEFLFSVIHVSELFRFITRNKNQYKNYNKARALPLYYLVFNLNLTPLKRLSI